jgi:hypothetical protein
MNANSFTPAQLQDLIKAEGKKYQKAIEIDKDFDEARIIFLKIKEYKKALDVFKSIDPEPWQYLHSR